MNRVLKVLCLMTLVAGCASARPTKVPMETLSDLQGNPAERVLLVMLPGAYDIPKDYFTYGFIDEIRRREWAVDVIAADANVNYYTGQNLVERLHHDVIVPARAKGYQQVWLGGISLGGFGSLLYVHQHPGEVQGVLLLAPYLGTRSQAQEIARSGGLAYWKPKRDLPLDEEQEMLVWLRDLLHADTNAPRLYLGYGTADRFVSSITVLAQTMPSDRVTQIEGGHDWPTWSKLWRLMLDKQPFDRADTARCKERC